MFARLGKEQFDQLVPASRQNESLVVVGHPIGSLLIQLL